MPNWVRSKLTIEGNNPQSVIDKITIDVYDDYEKVNKKQLDFNKIIPMPESLKVESGTLADNCIEIYLNTLEEQEKKEMAWLFYKASEYKYLTDNYGKKSKEQTDKLAQDILDNYKEPNFFREKTFHSLQDIIDYGKQICDNVKNYGFKDWYDWSINNWGTKWNAKMTEIQGNVIYFETAWDDVRCLIFELSKQYPDYSFEFEYSNEDIGVGCGSAEFQDGEVIRDCEYSTCSKEAWELAFELWNMDRDYFIFDEKKNTYKYIGDEEAEKLNQKKAKQTEQE